MRRWHMLRSQIQSDTAVPQKSKGMPQVSATITVATAVAASAVAAAVTIAATALTA